MSPPVNPYAGLGIDTDLMSPLQLDKEEEDEESHSNTSSGRGNMSGKFSDIEIPEPPFQRDPLPTTLQTDAVAKIDYDSFESSTPSPDMSGLGLVTEHTEPVVLNNMDIDLSLVPKDPDSEVSDSEDSEPDNNELPALIDNEELEQKMGSISSPPVVTGSTTTPSLLDKQHDFNYADVAALDPNTTVITRSKTKGDPPPFKTILTKKEKKAKRKKERKAEKSASFCAAIMSPGKHVDSASSSSNSFDSLSEHSVHDTTETTPPGNDATSQDFQ
jgi:hypothetical protein